MKKLIADPLAQAMADELLDTFKEWQEIGLSTLQVPIGLGDRNGVIRLTIPDIALICAKVAREHRAT